MPRLRRRAIVVVALAVAIAARSAQRAPVPDPIVILVSFDGWRWDYIDRAPVPNLAALAARGVRAKELIPSFPSLTFPNHYTIVTGLYPGHHGIVSNTMWTPSLGPFTLPSPVVPAAALSPRHPIFLPPLRPH